MKFSNVNKDFIIVEPIEQQKTGGTTVSKGGIHLIAEQKKPIKNMGRVVATEQISDFSVERPQYNVGDTVMFHPSAFHEFEYEGKTYFVVRLADVYFKLEDEVSGT